jgi:hypothetical protein
MMNGPDESISVPPEAPIPTANFKEATLRRLRSGPQTAIDPTALPTAVREELSVIAGDGAVPRAVGTEGAFIPVYYLPDSEPAAIELFVQLNTHRLAAMDLTQANPLKRRLSMGMYTRVLVAAGHRHVTRYDGVVVERRPDGTAWLVKPEWYDASPADRYTPGAHAARIPPDVNVQRLYDSSGTALSKDTVRATPIEGNVGLVLIYYRDADAYDCRPEITDDDTAILKKVGRNDDTNATE